MKKKDFFDLEKETLLMKYTQKQTTPEETRQVESWLKESND